MNCHVILKDYVRRAVFVVVRIPRESIWCLPTEKSMCPRKIRERRKIGTCFGPEIGDGCLHKTKRGEREWLTIPKRRRSQWTPAWKFVCFSFLLAHSEAAQSSISRQNIDASPLPVLYTQNLPAILLLKLKFAKHIFYPSAKEDKTMTYFEICVTDCAFLASFAHSNSPRK